MLLLFPRESADEKVTAKTALVSLSTACSALCTRWVLPSFIFAFPHLCYKIWMKISVRWVLFEYKGHELVILSKSLKTKKDAEKTRLKYPERRRRTIGVGVIRIPA